MTASRLELRFTEGVSPGEALRYTLNCLGWTQKRLAKIIKCPVPALNEIIHDKKRLTARRAVALARATGTSPVYWLTLDMYHQLRLARWRKKPT